MSWPMLPSRAISGSLALHQQGFGLISVTHVTTKGHSTYLVWAAAWGHIDVQGLCRSASRQFSQWLLHSEEQAPPLSWAAWESWHLAVAQVNQPEGMNLGKPSLPLIDCVTTPPRFLKQAGELALEQERWPQLQHSREQACT